MTDCGLTERGHGFIAGGAECSWAAPATSTNSHTSRVNPPAVGPVPSAGQMLVEDEAKPRIDPVDRVALLRPTRRRAGPRPHRFRPRWRWVALVVVLALVAGLGGGGYFAYATINRDANRLQAQLTAHLELAQRELEAAKTSLKQANASHDDKQIAEAKVHFINSKLQFLTASQ